MQMNPTKSKGLLGSAGKFLRTNAAAIAPRIPTGTLM